MKHEYAQRRNFILGLVLLTCASSCKKNEPASTISVRGGAAVAKDSWPHVGRLGVDARSKEGFYSENGFCTATMLCPTVILTARHCFEMDPGQTYAGARFSTDKGFNSKVTDFEFAGASKFAYDMAVAKLAPRSISDYTSGLVDKNFPELWQAPLNEAPQLPLLAIGYGLDGQGNKGRRLQGSVVASELTWGDKDFAKTDPQMLYVRAGSEGQLPCSGDSGGPLIADNKILATSVSNRNPHALPDWTEQQFCTHSETKGGYLPVSAHAEFIARKMKDWCVYPDSANNPFIANKDLSGEMWCDMRIQGNEAVTQLTAQKVGLPVKFKVDSVVNAQGPFNYFWDAVPEFKFANAQQSRAGSRILEGSFEKPGLFRIKSWVESNGANQVKKLLASCSRDIFIYETDEELSAYIAKTSAPETLPEANSSERVTPTVP